MRKLCLICAAAVLAVSAGCSDIKENMVYESEKTFFAMDTAVTFKGSNEQSEKAAEIFSELDSLFDRYSEESDVFKLNERQYTEPSDYTSEVIMRSCELSDKYGGEVSIFAGDITDCWNIGAENPKVPSQEAVSEALESFRSADFSLDTMSFANGKGSIDLGSVAKGYALDVIYEELGGDSCYIASAESSVLLSGKKPDGSRFSVSMRNPENSGEILGTISTDACFISTSGGSQRYFELDGVRYSHIFDLAQGRPSQTDLASVTVLCGSGIESDFLATLIFVKGTDGLGSFLENDDIKVIAVTNEKEIYLSGGIDFQLADGSGYVIKEYTDE